MFELIVLLGLATFLTAYLFLLPVESKPLQILDEKVVSDTAPNADCEQFDSLLVRNEFLLQLQSEIESALFPRPTDSVLKRHYDALVAVEVGNRLAQMPV